MTADSQIDKLAGLAAALLGGVACLAIIRLMREFDADTQTPGIRQVAERHFDSLASAIGLSGGRSDLAQARVPILRTTELAEHGRGAREGQLYKAAGGDVGGDETHMPTDLLSGVVSRVPQAVERKLELNVEGFLGHVPRMMVEGDLDNDRHGPWAYSRLPDNERYWNAP